LKRADIRNLANEKDPEIVRRLEHTSFSTGIDAALERLAPIKRLSYQDVLDTHKILFEAVYPWAGQDRLQIAPDLAVSRGPVLFGPPSGAGACHRVGQRPDPLGATQGFGAGR
jgi:cell filamentation protein